MEQRCHLVMVWLTWLGLPLLALVVGVRAGALASVLVLAVGIAGQWIYIKGFPSIAGWMGYGSVADIPAAPAQPAAPLPRVTLYTANVCPFCPIVKQRLAALQQRTPFDLDEVDVTFRPQIVRAKGLRAVPVIEANGRLLVGNATSADILAFLTAAPDSHVAAR
jgi:glutaredoxin